jgi:hypothetical protein
MPVDGMVEVLLIQVEIHVSNLKVPEVEQQIFV